MAPRPADTSIIRSLTPARAGGSSSPLRRTIAPGPAAGRWNAQPRSSARRGEIRPRQDIRFLYEADYACAILLITNWNHGQGGAEAYMRWLRDGLSAAGDEVRLLVSSAGNAANGSADYIAFGSNHLAAQAFLQIVNPSRSRQSIEPCASSSPRRLWSTCSRDHLSPAILLALRGHAVVLLVSDYKCICPIGSKLLPEAFDCEVRAGWVCHRNGCVGLAHWMRDLPRYALIR